MAIKRSERAVRREKLQKCKRAAKVSEEKRKEWTRICPVKVLPKQAQKGNRKVVIMARESVEEKRAQLLIETSYLVEELTRRGFWVVGSTSFVWSVTKNDIQDCPVFRKTVKLAKRKKAAIVVVCFDRFARPKDQARQSVHRAATSFGGSGRRSETLVRGGP